MPKNLQPLSTVSAIILPATGTHNQVLSSLSYGIYATTAFISGAVDQVAYTYQKLGGNVLDLEITPSNIYNAYEESCLEYSYLVNTHQAKNVLSDMLGTSTGSFNQDGEFVAYEPGTSVKPNLKFPRFQLGYATHIGRGVGLHIPVGASQTIYSASFVPVQRQQDYDLQKLIYTASLGDVPFQNQVGKSAITIQRVYYKTPQSMWNFFGGYSIGAVGNLSTYGMYADDSTFEMVPAWQNVLQAYAFKEDMNVRASHYSFEINNNKLRIYPVPDGSSPKKFWVDFRVSGEAFKEEDDRKYGAGGVSKETLGQIRSKLATIPIPGNDVTLNGPSLVSEAKEEQASLRDELKTVLDEMVYGKLAEGDAALQNSVSQVVQHIPVGIYVG